MIKVKKLLPILLVVLFVATVTAVAVDTFDGHGFGTIIGGSSGHPYIQLLTKPVCAPIFECS